MESEGQIRDFVKQNIPRSVDRRADLVVNVGQAGFGLVDIAVLASGQRGSQFGGFLPLRLRVMESVRGRAERFMTRRHERGSGRI